MKRQVILSTFMVVLTVSCAGGSGTREAEPAAKSSVAPEEKAPPGVETTVDVAVAEYSVEPSVSEAPAGTITFAPTIVKPDKNEAHNFVVVKTDLAPTALPTLPAGNADTTAEGVEVLGFLAEFGPGDTPTLKVEAAPGKYLLICNIIDHYKRGMVAPFTVS